MFVEVMIIALDPYGVPKFSYFLLDQVESACSFRERGQRPVVTSKRFGVVAAVSGGLNFPTNFGRQLMSVSGTKSSGSMGNARLPGGSS